MKNIILSSLLLIAAILVSIGFSEALTRFVVHPVDYLRPTIEEDTFLNHRIAPRTAGHDDWGYRNYSVPDKAEIVAIGDSQTYGVSATFRQSWPALLAQLRDSNVYNMGLLGYGPLHYFHMLKTKAVNLDPAVIIVGVYFGNDLLDAYNLAYSNARWKTFRGMEDAADLDPALFVSAGHAAGKFLGGLRDWLAKNSVLYRITTKSVIGDMVRNYEAQQSSELFKLQVAGSLMFFEPDKRYTALNLDDSRIQEGIRLTYLAIKEIKQICAEENIRLIVALIPTKEQVYSELISRNIHVFGNSDMERLIESEQLIRDQFSTFLEEQGVEYVDLLPVLQIAARSDVIYPVNDGHPNGSGYSVIAKELNRIIVGGQM